ncbi:MAG TPA: LuxR C-terminal-related transcriptional regulator [Thermoanaerobaculia bacterium]
MAIRVLIADDALARLLSAERDVEIVVQRRTSGEDVVAISVDPRQITRLDAPPSNGDAKNLLTRRELDIVRMAALGARNKKIAEELGIAEGTVKMHLHTIYEKLEISGRVELSIYAREHALV